MGPLDAGKEYAESGVVSADTMVKIAISMILEDVYAAIVNKKSSQ